MLVLFASSVMFLRQFPARTRRLMVMAGAISVAGAIGFEVLGGWRFDVAQLALVPGRIDVVFLLLFTCEEMLEMIGMAIFLFAVRDYELDQRHRETAVPGGSC